MKDLQYLKSSHEQKKLILFYGFQAHNIFASNNHLS